MDKIQSLQNINGNQLSNVTYVSTGAHANALIGTVSALKQSKGLVSAISMSKMNKLISYQICQCHWK